MWIKRNEQNEIIEARSFNDNGCDEFLKENNKELKAFLTSKGV